MNQSVPAGAGSGPVRPVLALGGPRERQPASGDVRLRAGRRGKRGGAHARPAREAA